MIKWLKKYSPLAAFVTTTSVVTVTLCFVIYRFRTNAITISVNSGANNLADIKSSLDSAFEEFCDVLTVELNWLMIWAAVLTIVFLVFSVLGLYRIDEELRKIEEKSKEIDEKAEARLKQMSDETDSFWENLSALMFAKDVTPGTMGAFQEEAFSCLKGTIESSKSNAVKLYFLAEFGHARSNTGEFKLAIDSFTDAITQIEREKESPARTIKLQILFLRRGFAYRGMGVDFSRLKQGDSDRDAMNDAISDFKKALSFDAGNRFKAFICTEIATTYLRLEDFQKAHRYCECAEKYYLSNGSADDVRGDVYRAQWRASSPRLQFFYERACEAYERAVGASRRQATGIRSSRNKLHRLRREYRRYIERNRNEKE